MAIFMNGELRFLEQFICNCYKMETSKTTEYMSKTESKEAKASVKRIHSTSTLFSNSENKVRVRKGVIHFCSDPFLVGKLEPIPQDEELKTDDVINYSSINRSLSNESTSSTSSFEERDHWPSKFITATMKEESKNFLSASSCSTVKYIRSQKSEQSSKLKANLKSSFQMYSQNLKPKIKQLQIGSEQEQIVAIRETCLLMEQAWSVPTYGRDLAYGLCDVLRNEKALDIIVKNCASPSKDLMRSSARLLEKIMTTRNRQKVADDGLDIVVKMTVETKGESEMARVNTGILESLFKTSVDTCSRLTDLGGLDVILYWCRCNDRLTLRHCAIALTNMALYGGSENQEEMAKHKVPEWLFPLAFNDDDSVRYYACLAISVLVANKEIEAAVQNSGTLELVLPFISSHTPKEFARMDMSHRHGRSRGWLKRLVPVLSSKREEAQSLAAFHFAMEAGIKVEQDRKEVFYEIEAIEPLKKLASSPNATASKLAAEALKIIGEEIPHRLTQQVPVWSVNDVVFWVTQVGFGDYSGRFGQCKVDGDILLLISEDDLRDSIGITCSIARKRFLRELKALKITAEYVSCDSTNLDDWMADISPDYSQYTYQMLKSGVDKPTLIVINDNDLKNECASKDLFMSVNSSIDSTDGSAPLTKCTDVFISYRRASGSQLASLLKVHLQLRGFTVFLDIEKLRAGKFDEGLLNSVMMSKHFILVLTPNALDRCVGDDEQNDWVHKEIAAAIESGCNIIPVMDNFQWPPADTLPEDMRQITYFNGIRWIHDYQDACVDKLEKFLRGEYVFSTSKRGNLFQMGSSQEGVIQQRAAKFSSSESELSPNSPSRDSNN
ncbi:hypothetical protein KUTeg_009828 [Tegillarca granosa]|uniref:ADP-ribosyl cyclase/cyclic ADP-ribose hydrolase n=1 Tax=Tegillarca granosa TaxID=220873 RepID=A0ABQ9F506_TEGGR|nr:hypothetical protein KUTeg_009828 [Tegillarca granosa]